MTNILTQAAKHIKETGEWTAAFYHRLEGNLYDKDYREFMHSEMGKDLQMAWPEGLSLKYGKLWTAVGETRSLEDKFFTHFVTTETVGESHKDELAKMVDEAKRFQEINSATEVAEG